jgi:hypothetical protein
MMRRLSSGRACNSQSSGPAGALRAKHPASLHQAPHKSPSTPKLWSMFVECAAEKQEDRDKDGDPEDVGRDAEAAAEAEAHRNFTKSRRPVIPIDARRPLSARQRVGLVFVLLEGGA